MRVRYQLSIIQRTSCPVYPSALASRSLWQMWSSAFQLRKLPPPATSFLLSHFRSPFHLELSPFRFGSAKVTATFSFSNSCCRIFLFRHPKTPFSSPPEPSLQKGSKTTTSFHTLKFFRNYFFHILSNIPFPVLYSETSTETAIFIAAADGIGGRKRFD